MEQRTYHYFYEDERPGTEGSLTVEDIGQLNYKTVPVDKMDRFKGELAMFAFPIKYLFHVNHLLQQFNLNDDIDYFYTQCRDVLAVPETHQDEQGKEGKLNFQVFFHNVPDSLAAINDRAIVVVVLDISKAEKNEKGQLNYKLAGYIHANEFEFSPPGTDQLLPGYYYNVLRISEAMEDGKKLYRRSGVFSTLFSVLLDLVNQNDVHFIYAAMGKANKKINSALIKLAEHYDKQWDIHEITSNSKVSFLYGSSSAANQLVKITDDPARLEEMYEWGKGHLENQLFNQYPTFDHFYHYYQRIMDYSRSSDAYMITDAQGNMRAACVALNWGDFFAFLLDNPKGIFKLLAKLELTEKLLYPWMTAGEPQAVKTLYKGLAHKYLKHEKAKLALLNSYAGDPYESLKKSLITDPFNYFVIYDRPEQYEQYKERSKDSQGNTRIFIETPLF